MHYAEPISTVDVAAALDCNPDHLGRVFRRAEGRTVVEAIHAHRIAQARRMLLDGGATVDAVARACGYPDPGYFRRVFRRCEGLSPGRYRRLYARVHVNAE
ncbi:MAG: helix-turn-helix transcriptional regulator [Planctomycetota bacterium]